MNPVEIVRLQQALQRSDISPVMVDRIVVRLSPREWHDFRRQIDGALWGMEDRTWTSCKFYSIRVEVDPNAA